MWKFTIGLLASVAGMWALIAGPAAVAADYNVHPQPGHDGKSAIYYSYDRAAKKAYIRHVDLKTGKTKTLLENGFGNSNPSMSPDGRYLTYASRRPDTDGVAQIFIYDLKEKKERQVTSSPLRKSQTSWMPDGEWISYIKTEEGKTSTWRLRVSDGKEELVFDFPGTEYHPKWSGNGDFLVVDVGLERGIRGIDMFNVKSGEHKTIVEHSNKHPSITPSISPDSTHLAYADVVIEKGKLVGSRLWSMDLRSGKKTMLYEATAQGNQVGAPVWVTDKDIVFYASTGRVHHIYTVQRNGSGFKQLSQ